MRAKIVYRCQECLSTKSTTRRRQPHTRCSQNPVWAIENKFKWGSALCRQRYSILFAASRTI